MNKIFAPFLPPWAETGLQPAFYDVESGTVLQQTARMYNKVNQLTRLFNEFSEATSEEVNAFEREVNDTVAEYIEKFTELKDFVEDYFDNLDVQEEVNHKLDEMAGDGTLQALFGGDGLEVGSDDKIKVKAGDGIEVDSDGVKANVGTGITISDGKIAKDFSGIKFHDIKASSATYIVELPNGKNLICDSGKSTEWTDIKDAIDALGITKFDYAITTHFHNDHDGNTQNLIDTYDFSDCTWWIQMKPDYSNHSADIDDSELAYNTAVTLLTANGITPVVPTNLSEVVLDVDAGIKIQFFNTDATIAENYYGRIAEYRSSKINFNAFSLIARITYGNQSILLTGDIEEYVEEQYAEYMKKATIMTAPHHGINLEAYESFYTAVSPEVTICQFITTSPTWVESYYKEFYYIVENSKKVVTAYNSKSDNEFYSFRLDGDSYDSNVLDGGLTESSPNYKLGSYVYIDSLIDTTKVARDQITFKDFVKNLPIGCTANIPFYSNYATSYAQLVTDIKVFYAALHGDFMVKIEHNSKYYLIEIIESYNDFSCKIHVSENEWEIYNTTDIIQKYTTGTGILSADSEALLLTRIAQRPSGTYRLAYKDASNANLANAYYEGIATIVMESTRTCGYLCGSVKNTSITTKANMAGYFDTSAVTKVRVSAWD